MAPTPELQLLLTRPHVKHYRYVPEQELEILTLCCSKLSRVISLSVCGIVFVLYR